MVGNYQEVSKWDRKTFKEFKPSKMQRSFCEGGGGMFYNQAGHLPSWRTMQLPIPCTNNHH